MKKRDRILKKRRVREARRLRRLQRRGYRLFDMGRLASYFKTFYSEESSRLGLQQIGGISYKRMTIALPPLTVFECEWIGKDKGGQPRVVQEPWHRVELSSIA